MYSDPSEMSDDEGSWMSDMSDELSVPLLNPENEVRQGPLEEVCLPTPRLNEDNTPRMIMEYMNEELREIIEDDDFYIAKDLRRTYEKVLDHLMKPSFREQLDSESDNRYTRRFTENYTANPDDCVIDLILNAVQSLEGSSKIGAQDRRDMEYLLGRRETCMTPGDVAIRFNDDGTLTNRFSGFSTATLEFLKQEAGADDSSSFANRHVVAAHGMRNAYNLMVGTMGAQAAETQMSQLLHEAIAKCNATATPDVNDPNQRKRVFATWEAKTLWSQEAKDLFKATYQEVADKCPIDWVVKHHFPPGWVENSRQGLVDNGASVEDANKALHAEVSRKRDLIIALYMMNSNPENLWRGSAAVNSALPQKYTALISNVSELTLDSYQDPWDLMDELDQKMADLKSRHKPSREAASEKTGYINEYLTQIEAEIDRLTANFKEFVQERMSVELDEMSSGLDEYEVDEHLFAIKLQIIEAYARLEVDLLGSSAGNESSRSGAREAKASADYGVLQALSGATEGDSPFTPEDAASMFQSLLDYNELGVIGAAGFSDDAADDDDDDSEGSSSAKRAKRTPSDDIGDDPEKPLKPFEVQRRGRRDAQLKMLEKLEANETEIAIINSLYDIGMLGVSSQFDDTIREAYQGGDLSAAQMALEPQHNGTWTSVDRDGNCLFHCLAVFLGKDHAHIRAALADAIKNKDPTIMPYITNPAVAEEEIRRDGSYVGEAAFMTHYSALLFGLTIRVVEEDGSITKIGNGATPVDLARAHNHFWYFKKN